MEQNTQEFVKKNLWGIIIFVVVVVVGAYYFGVSSGKQSDIITPSQNQNTVTNSQPQISGGVYDYTEAPQHIGEYASVKGTVVKVANSKSGTIFFDYCSNYKTCPFSAVIFSSAAGRFSNPYQYQGQAITITGQIKTYQGKAEIILDSQNQIKNVSAQNPSSTKNLDPTIGGVADTYSGGYSPDGSFCNYGYNYNTKMCCDDDNYSCEVRDKAPKGATQICVDETYSFSKMSSACIGHGGVQTDPQYTPYWVLSLDGSVNPI